MMAQCNNATVSLRGWKIKSGVSVSAVSEACWFLLSLVLFMILGPFAGPIAIIAILTSQESKEREMLPEPDCVDSI